MTAVKTTMFFTGDINLMQVTRADTPFSKVIEVLKGADLRFANLECSIYEPPDQRFAPADGLLATRAAAESLRLAGLDIVGTANNGNYGAEAIASNLEALDQLGIKQTGSGNNISQAYRPAVAEVNGLTVGILQRTSVYWPMGHEATEHSPGVAVLQGHTSYILPLHRSGPHQSPLNRPGVDLETFTWADPLALARLKEDIEELRSHCDVVIASHHWGLKRDVLQYMTEIAHAAIDAGAHAVVGHGPHFPMAVEVYKGSPVFYSLSSFCYNVGHSGKRSGNWIGQMARIAFDGCKLTEAAFRWVRHNDSGETYFSDPCQEAPALEDVADRSRTYGTQFKIDGGEVKISI